MAPVPAGPPGSAAAGHKPLPLPGSAGDVLARGVATLRFPPALEAQFEADDLAPRRRWLLICGVIGLIAICLGSLELPRLMPDAPDVALRNLYLILAVVIPMQLLVWRMPVAWRRCWQAEAMTAVPILVVNAAVIHDCLVTRADTMFTHSAALVSTLMFGCIAARLRFVWALGCAIVSFLAYASLVKGTTPQQELIVGATVGLMALSYVFALVANYAFEYSDRRNWLLRRVDEQQRGALKETSARLHQLSIRDPLTRLFNRRHFDAELGMAWSTAAVAQRPLAMLMVDVDHFKRYNDTYGHPAGDACLIQVAKVLEGVAQAHGGVAARLGGEEFGLLLPEHSQQQLQNVGEALCAQVRAAGMAHQASDVAPHVTISVGAAQLWPRAGAGAQALVGLADQALYQAKTSGRDRVCLALVPDQAGADVLASDGPTATAAAIGASSGHGMAMAEDAMPSPAVGDETPSAEATLSQVLAGGFRRLSFPRAQEKAYRAHNAGWRRTHLAVMSVVGILIYVLYLYANRAMFSDVQHSVLPWFVGISVGTLMLALVNHFSPVPLLWREGFFSLGNALMGILTAWLLSQSEQLTALAFSVCLALIPMFSGVAARQPFWFTCVPALITCVAAGVFLRPADATQNLVFADSLTMIVTNTVFTLMLSYTLEHGARKAWLLSHIERLQAEALQAATAHLHELSMLDPLTGICNRRQFEEDLQRIWGEGVRDGRAMAMLIIDVDFFKRYNDGYGHPEGDRCLKQVATAIAQTAQAGKGLAARLGGEEFGILLPGADATQAVYLGEQVCAAVRQMGLAHRFSQVAGLSTVSVSVGVASVKASRGVHRRSLFALADEALYLAKKDGRNRVAVVAERPA